MNKLIPAIAILFLLASCGQPKNVTLTNTSPNGKTKVTVTGKKEGSLDPFHVTMTVKSGDLPEGSLMFDVYASELTDSNPHFDWPDAQHATITFVQTDNEKRIFSLSVSATNVQVVPLN